MPPSDPRSSRPHTAVLHQFVGIGDLVWHLPYFEAVARESAGGQVAVIASPTTFARQLLEGLPWVAEVIDFDRRPRRSEGRQGRHAGVAGLFRMGRELRDKRFERIVLFSGHPNRGFVAWLAGIPQRLGYGTGWLQRRFLNQGPYIQRYEGPSVSVFNEAASYALAHGWCSQRLVPKIQARPAALHDMRERLAALPRPLYAFAIGTSEPFKQWGQARYAELATRLIERGCGVVLLGGPGETQLAEAIVADVPAALRHGIRAGTKQSILHTVAALRLADGCVGNDTGVTNLAVACDLPTFVLLGKRPLLDLDPLMHMLRGPSLDAIGVQDVLAMMQAQRAPGFNAA